MFEGEWKLQWEPQLFASTGDTQSHERLINWVQQYRVITAKSADWFHVGKRESKEALKNLVIKGVLVKGVLFNGQKKITVYSCSTPHDVNECVRKIVLEGILDSLLEKFPEIEWQNNFVRIHGQILRLEALVGERHPINGAALWVGPDWDSLKKVLQPGQFGTTMDLWNNGVIMHYENENWLPGTIEKELFLNGGI